MARDPLSFTFELEYWRALLEELGASHDRLGELSDELETTTVASAVVALTLGDSPLGDELVKAMRATDSAMKLALAIQRHLLAIQELAQGRLTALTEEAEGLEEAAS